MAKIKVSAMVPERRELRTADPTGETWVKIKPPGYEEEIERGRLTSKRSYHYTDSGYPVTNVDVNTRLLWAEEIWLTYVETNLEVEMGQGEDVETITFEPRAKSARGEFMEALAKLPPAIVYEWHAMVVDVVPEWTSPF